MDDLDRQLLIDNPHWALILDAYVERIEQLGIERTEEEQGVRWATRLEQFSEVDADELSGIHGQMIACGWLTFQLEGREAGLFYRVTKEGRQALDWVKTQSELSAA